MASFAIPRAYRNGVKLLFEQGDEHMRQYLAALKADSPPIHPADLPSHIASEAPSLSETDVRAMTRALLALYTVRVRLGVPVQTFAADVAESEDLDDVSEGEKGRGMQRLIELLNLPSLEISAKALDLLNEYERVMHDARILTDIRPVFTGEETDLGAVTISHTLRIRYHEGGELREFYVFVDPHNVAALRDLLDRADAKSRTLGSMLERAGVPSLNAETE